MELQVQVEERKGGDTYTRARMFCTWVFIALLAASAVAVRVSTMTTSVRLLLVGTFLFGLFFGLYLLLKAYPRALYPVLFFVALVAAWTFLANKPPDRHMLRQAYVKRLTSFEGVHYMPGGETTEGIDSAGLARTAFWQAMMRQGIREANPRLLGVNFWKFWFRDISARDMFDSKYGYTRVIGYAPELAGHDTSKLRVGDLAVAGGAHVMIYYGKAKWIEANPDDKMVVVNRAPANSKRRYFRVPVKLMRWWIL